MSERGVGKGIWIWLRVHVGCGGRSVEEGMLCRILVGSRRSSSSIDDDGGDIVMLFVYGRDVEMSNVCIIMRSRSNEKGSTGYSVSQLGWD